MAIVLLISICILSVVKVSCREIESISYKRPSYICLNKGWPVDWDASRPATFTQESIDIFLNSFNNTISSPSRKLCISFNMWTLFNSNATLYMESLDALLSLVEKNNLPLSISLDATQWWQGHPELYNWWNSSEAGYSPDNVNNVEWYGPSSTHAIKISWRNWGSQFRMPSPHPNFSSIAFRKAASDSIIPLAKRIAQWHDALDLDRKYLLAYVRASQELWIGTNYYYYEQGNNMLYSDPKLDPKSGPNGAMQLGFASICGHLSTDERLHTSGCDGKSNLSVAQLDTVVKSYLSFAANVLIECGIPRTKIMAHTGSFFNKGDKISFNSPSASVIDEAFPAWSMYGSSSDANNDKGVNEALALIDNAVWGAPEWLASSSTSEPVQFWSDSFHKTLVKNNRLIVVQNFESIKNNNNALKSVSLLVKEGVSCLVDATFNLKATLILGSSTSYRLSWNNSYVEFTEKLFIVASSSKDTHPSSILKNDDILPLTEINKQSTTFNLDLSKSKLTNSIVFWGLVSNGCNNTQTIFSENSFAAVPKVSEYV